MEPNTTIPRVSDRRPLRLMVKSRVESRAIHVDMIDISTGGCKIRGTDGFASVGDRVTMKIANMHAPVGHVAWGEGVLPGSHSKARYTRLCSIISSMPNIPIFRPTATIAAISDCGGRASMRRPDRGIHKKIA